MPRGSQFYLAKSKFCDKVKVEIKRNKSSKSIDPYACAIKIKYKYLGS